MKKTFVPVIIPLHCFREFATNAFPLLGICELMAGGIDLDASSETERGSDVRRKAINLRGRSRTGTNCNLTMPPPIANLYDVSMPRLFCILQEKPNDF